MAIDDNTVGTQKSLIRLKYEDVNVRIKYESLFKTSLSVRFIILFRNCGVKTPCI